jgi:hypothetical protein
MATCREVIQSAYRRSGILAAGVNMNASQANVGLELLIGMYRNFIVGGMFGRPVEKYLDTDSAYEAKEGQRVFNEGGATITLPTRVMDAGEYRAPRDGAFIVVVNPSGSPQQHIYDAGLGQWQALSSLALSSEAPLSGRFEDHIKNMLAVRLLGEAGQPTPPELTRAEGRARLALSNRQDAERRPGVGVFS